MDASSALGHLSRLCLFRAFPLHDGNNMKSDTQKPKQGGLRAAPVPPSAELHSDGEGKEDQGMESRFSTKEPLVSETSFYKEKQDKPFMTKKKLTSPRIRGAEFP